VSNSISEATLMPDAKSVDGAPTTPVIRKRVTRKSAVTVVAAAAPDAPEIPANPVAPSVPKPPPAAPGTPSHPATPTPDAVPTPPAPQPAAPTPAPEPGPPPVVSRAPEQRPPERPADRPPEQRPEHRPERYERQDRPPQQQQRPQQPQQQQRPMDRRPDQQRGPGPQQRFDQRGPNNNGNNRPQYNDRPDRPDRYERQDRPPQVAPANGEPRPQPVPATSRLDDLYRMPMAELFKLAETEGMREVSGHSRAQLIVGVVRRQIERGVVVKGSGTLEVLPDGYGFLRSAAHNYLASPEDIYVSPSQIRRMSLRTGLIVEGPIRLPIENQDNFALMQIEQVNTKRPDEGIAVTGFGDLTATHPNSRFLLETTGDEISTRIVDLVTPLGKGQRALIVAPPRTGKTILLSKIANAIMKNHPETYVFVLLVDERPEEVTEMQRLVQGTNAEVVASTFDEPPEEHIHVSEIVLEKAKRMVENKRDVVILLDSITRLARAHNAEAPGGGKLLTGGLDSNAMQKPKTFFGAARNCEEGGSLTIVATALIDTGSRMDDVIFEEFKGTGNSELHLDRRLVEKRVYPAIDVNKSGTRKEDLLLHPDELAKISLLRRVLADMHPVEAMELLVNRAKKTKSNAEFLMTMNLG
jgi:transcription termination factor Rho